MIKVHETAKKQRKHWIEKQSLRLPGAEIEKRIRNRGDVDLIGRALFLKKKLEAMPENRGHLYNTTGKQIDEMIREIVPEHWLLRQ